MVIASIFAGIISVVCPDGVPRRCMYVGGGGSATTRTAGPLILIGLAIAAIGYVLAIVIRMMLSRTREYRRRRGLGRADQEPRRDDLGAEEDVGHGPSCRRRTSVQGMFLDNEKEGVIDGLFATHPPIDKRIEALVKFAAAGPGAIRRDGRQPCRTTRRSLLRPLSRRSRARSPGIRRDREAKRRGCG